MRPDDLNMYRALKRSYEWDLEDELNSCDVNRLASGITDHKL
jgi:hypothetical protein